MDDTSDSLLLERARTGDVDAISALVLAHERAVRGYVGRLAPDPVTADDLAQEVFLAALRSFDRIDPALGVRGYLLGAARNLVRMEWRRCFRSREVRGETLFESLESSRVPAGDSTDRRLEALQACVEQLLPRVREVVLGHYRDELLCEELAARFHLKPGSVRSILTRSRQLLRECVERRIGEAFA
jgi:RNA polymerase sigma-70 factor, ECF subfamily